MANNDLYINYMSRTYAGVLNSLASGSGIGERKDFGSLVAEKESSERAEAAEKVEAAFRDNMSLDEYKLYIYDRISQIPQDPSQAGWNWYVDISEAGFEAMKNDPDYEACVLDSIRRNFAAVDPFHSSTFSILHFGASEEESFANSYSYDSPAQHLQDEEESDWEKRKARRKKLQELLDDLAEKKAVARRQGLPEPTMPDINSILELLCAGV